MEPEPLATFKGVSDTLLTNIEIPERAERRSKTDRYFLYIFVGIIFSSIPCMIYTLTNSNVNRLLNGYDECGNVCGDYNVGVSFPGVDCAGKDMSSKPYLEFANQTDAHLHEALRRRYCTESCTGSNSFINRCTIESTEISDEYWTELDMFLKDHAGKIVLGTLFAILLTLVIFFLFRIVTVVIVWGILIGALILVGFFVVGSWKVYANTKQGLIFAIAFIITFIWIGLICVTIFMRRTIQLVIQLLKEATKAAFAMPQLIIISIISFFALLIVYITTLTCLFHMLSAGKLLKLIYANKYFLVYYRTDFMDFTMIYSAIAAFWLAKFIIGIQYMIIAGAVSKWYFAKNKRVIDKPVSKSALIVFKYHLGSIAFGSMIITIITLIRSVLNTITRNRHIKIFIECCLKGGENLIKFLSKSSYIIIAMHGQPFFKSGKRAAQINFKNAINVIVINKIGYFIIIMSQTFIILLTMIVTASMIISVDNYERYGGDVLIISGINAAIVAKTFFGLLETVVDTIFLCFCEDSLMNDGITKPYAMSTDLMKFVKNSKKVLSQR